MQTRRATALVDVVAVRAICNASISLQQERHAAGQTTVGRAVATRFAGRMTLFAGIVRRVFAASAYLAADGHAFAVRVQHVSWIAGGAGDVIIACITVGCARYTLATFGIAVVAWRTRTVTLASKLEEVGLARRAVRLGRAGTGFAAGVTRPASVHDKNKRRIVN